MAINKFDIEELNPKFISSDSKQGWTLFLVFCCITASMSSFQFGFNIGSLNSPTVFIKDFIRNETFLFSEYHTKLGLFNLNEGWLEGNQTLYDNALLDYETKKSEYAFCKLYSDEDCVNRMDEQRRIRAEEILKAHNRTIDEHFAVLGETLKEKRAKLEGFRVLLADGSLKVDRVTDVLWTIVNCLFVIGGMVGAFTSKFVLDTLGRKKGILFNAIFPVVGSVLVLIAPWVKSPVCLVVSRFIFGVQGGMACSLIPTYINEISPSSLRGQTGVIPQLFITIGILFAQIFGFKEILGGPDTWNFLLSFPLLPAVFGSVLLLLFFPETPKALLIKNKDVDAAKKALQQLRHNINVSSDIQEIYDESYESSSSDKIVTLRSLITLKEFRWPLITSLLLQIIQQLSGINAVFFYSSSIFLNAGIHPDYIQYAILSTGLVNMVTTVLCVPLIDRIGRKPLLVVPMAIMIVDFVALTLMLQFKDTFPIFSTMSIVCVMIFVICFAIGLGPIPFIYSAECFRQNARSSAMALCIFTNWLSGLLLTLAFPFLQSVIEHYVFLVFTGIIGLVLAIIITKMPETKGKKVEDIIASF